MPKAFLCHSSDDKPFARRLSTSLRAFGIDTWLDEAEIRPGDSLIGKIEEGLTATDYLLVILSPSSVNSEWCKRELRSALTFEIAKRSMTVIPVIAVRCEIPPFLADKLYVDFTKLSESSYSEALSRLLSAFLDHDELLASHPKLVERWARRLEGATVEEFRQFVASELETQGKRKFVDDYVAAASAEYVTFLLRPDTARDDLSSRRLALVAAAYGCISQCSKCSRVTVDTNGLAIRLKETHLLNLHADTLASLLFAIVPAYTTMSSDGYQCWVCFDFDHRD